MYSKVLEGGIVVATTKKTTQKKQVTKKPAISRKEENKRHIFAGFLLGLSTGMLFFAVYLVSLYCI